MKKWLIIAIVVLVAVSASGYFYFQLINQVEQENRQIDVSKFVPFNKWESDLVSQAAENLENKKNQELEQEISLVLVGDIMLSRNVGAKMKKYGDYHYPFLKVQELISGADISFGNLESPIAPGTPVPTGSFVFRADPESVEGLDWAGFDVLSLANNHILNKGTDGLTKTFGYLSAQGIDYCGAMKDSKDPLAQMVVKEIKGRKIAFLCYAYGPDYYAVGPENPGMALMDSEQLKADLTAAQEQTDFVIVSMHDGAEYQNKSSKHQQDFARLAIDSGADLVVGHHPHVVQEVEKYKGKYIFYSLGNFVFDQMWSEETREGVAVKIILSKNEVKDIEYLPVIIEDYSQPRPADEKEKERIVGRMDLKDGKMEKVN